jgi:hypothetical protein
VELGRYLCEVRAGQYWRLENLKSFDEFLERRFPESRRKAITECPFMSTLCNNCHSSLHRQPATIPIHDQHDFAAAWRSGVVANRILRFELTRHL